MDIQTPEKNHSSGGVHLCHKCGWPFPNPHPSAKQRRSHKKICGTSEGYKLFNSAEEPLSEECHKTPFAGAPKVLESCNLEKHIGGVGAISVRSEDEVFSDAPMEFQEGGFGLGRQASVAGNDLTPTVSFKDCEDTCDVIAIETEPLVDVPEESRKLGDGSKVAECSARQDVSEESWKVGGGDKVAKCSLRQETDTEDGEISETVSLSETRPDGTSGTVLSDVMVQLEEEVSDRLDCRTSINENTEQEVDGNENVGINLVENIMNVVDSNSEQACATSEGTDDITSNTRFAEKIVEDKEHGDKLALNMVTDDLSHKAESAKDIDVSLDTSQIQIDAAQVTVSDTSFDSNEVYDKTEEDKTVKLSELETLASEEIIVKEKDEDGDRVSHEKSDTFPLKKLNEDNKADTSCTHVAEDIYKLDRSDPAIVKEGLVEGKADMIQLDKGSEALVSFVGADKTENETGSEVCSLEEKQPVYVEARKLNNVYGSDDMDVPESARTGVIDLAEVDDTRRIDDENNVKSTPIYDSSLSQTNPALNLLENSTSESVIPHHQSIVVTKGGSNEYTIALPETEGPHSNSVWNSPGDIKESKISRNSKEQGECAGKVMASVAENSGGNEFDESSLDQLNKESIHPDPESTTQNSDAVNDSRTGESRADISWTSTISVQGEADNCSIKPQLGATIGDVSKSSSQTDSLDGQWGSVSGAVISTRSDNLPINNLHLSSEPEKANVKKPTVASGEQLDKTDEFEPPSFMTLVEPGGSDQTTPATTVPLQAGWFPSLTHTANESHGRKKNEEIIAKVTNWNAKQHTPLKSLLGEAINETKQKSPNSNVAMVTKVSSILGPESPDAKPTGVEAAKEWNSPARYEADIKKEKRKVKGRPLWAQFVCCSYVN
ncbi:uncharacterized protein LOC120135135 [Hibiscus syriacus]|uniref:uncharacterized protein LOC120135135 n=1 Tax=Hibiscus syriacus TaxID=106335 RepID=UPI001920ADC2|nr:uncharacterized protein LOC120135135 [Hibiscus syriacus]